MKASEIGWRLPKDRDVKVELLECPRAYLILVTVDLGRHEAETLRKGGMMELTSSRTFFFPPWTTLVMGEQEYNEE